MQDDARKILIDAERTLKAGDLEKARQFLDLALKTYSNDFETCCWAWFFLYRTASTDEKTQCLINGLSSCFHAHSAYPTNDKLTNILSRFKISLWQTIDNAIKNGENDKARNLLNHIIECDGNNEKGWALESWLSLEKIADSDEEHINCLRKILTINAKDSESQKKLATFLENQSITQNLKNNQKDEEITKDNDSKDILQLIDESENSIKKSTDSTEEKFPITSSVEEKLLKRWNEPFETGNDIVQHFIFYIDELIKILQIYPHFQEDIKNLNSIKERRTHWDDKKSMNFFVSPAIKVAMNISASLLEYNKYDESFWTANIFSEMCKALACKDHKKNQEYQSNHRNLIVTACCAVGCSYWHLNKTVNKIEELRNPIEKICLKKALSTFFHPASNQYRQFRNENKGLKDEILNNSLAWIFDRRLQYLLENERAGIPIFVETNFPSIYQLKFFGKWQNSQEKWTELLIKEGFGEILHTLKKSNSLINRSEIGKISPAQFEEILNASRNNDYKLINELLKNNAEQLVSFLHYEMNEKFDYREPHLPFLDFKDKLNREFKLKVPKLASSTDQKKLQLAERITKKILKRDSEKEEENQQAIFSYYDWLGYIQLKMGKGDTAEQHLSITQKRRKDRTKNFITHWNLAVFAYRRKKEKKTYDLLFPFLEYNTTDTDLVSTLLMLAHELDDFVSFFELVTRTLHRQFFPLAFVMAYEHADEKQQRKFLGKILEEKSSTFQLPPVDTQFSNYADFRKTVEEARVEVPLQLMEWLESRIKSRPFYIPNYVELARVLEKSGELDRAFSTLCERFKKSKSIKNQKAEHIHDACRELLEFCKRNKCQELGQQAYDLLANSDSCKDVLKSFENFSSSLNKITSVAELPKREKTSIRGTVKKLFGNWLGNTKQTVGMFIDHENLLRSLENISRNRGKQVPKRDDAKAHWLFGILQKLTEEFVKRTGNVTHYKIAVAFWNRPSESGLCWAYEKNGFILQQPEDFKLGNAVDFKLVDEVRRLQKQENSKLKEIIIVSGDTDYAHMASSLIKEGIAVQIWGGNESINQASYGEIVGKNNIVIIDDICGL